MDTTEVIWKVKDFLVLKGYDGMVKEEGSVCFGSVYHSENLNGRNG
jgi:hypothetical protein